MWSVIAVALFTVALILFIILRWKYPAPKGTRIITPEMSTLSKSQILKQNEDLSKKYKEYLEASRAYEELRKKYNIVDLDSKRTTDK